MIAYFYLKVKSSHGEFNVEDNNGLLEKLNAMNYNGQKVLRAETAAEANVLYEHGADDVIFPRTG